MPAGRHRRQLGWAAATLLALASAFVSCKGEPTVSLGKPCTDGADCLGGLVCLTDFPGGYCSAACEESADCESGICGSEMCLRACTQADDCRPEYACLNMGRSRGCAPRGSGLGGLGDNCSSAADCQSGLQCSVIGSGSQCTKECTSVLNCGVGGLCAGGLCRHTCESAIDCDEDQSCEVVSAGRICEPGRTASGVGGACGGDEDCESGLYCLTDAPGGYCTRECTSPSQCSGGICSGGLCFSGCSAVQPVIDYLFVIDDSPGMESVHLELSASIDTFFTGLEAAGADYRIGIVTTDVDTGGVTVSSCRNRGGILQHEVVDQTCTAPTLPWISQDSTPDPSATFSCVLSAIGTDGCGFEQPLDAVQYALSSTVNPGFVRPEAELVILLVTTEDDCSAQVKSLYDIYESQYGEFSSLRCFSYGLECDGGPDVFTSCQTRPITSGGTLHPIGRFVAQLEAVKGDLGRVRVHALAGPPSSVVVGEGEGGTHELVSVCQGGFPDVKPAVRLQELTQAVGGTLHSLCLGMTAVWPALLAGLVAQEGCRTGYRCSDATEGLICEPM